MSEKKMPFTISEKKLKEAKELRKIGKHGKCCAYGCSNKAIPKKKYLCHKHYARWLRKADPVGVRYSQMKQKAKARGLEFTIRIKWFRRWCQKTGYLIVKGRRGQNATVDRLCNIHGYHEWNIGLKTNRHNASKGNGFNTHKDKFKKPREEPTLEEMMADYDGDEGGDLPF